MTRRVAITGIGLLTPLGNDGPTFFANALEGRRKIHRIRKFNAASFSCQIGAELDLSDPEFQMPPECSGEMTTVAKWSVFAARKAVKDAGLDLSKEDRSRIDVVTGSSISSLESLESSHLEGAWRGMAEASPATLVRMNPAAAAIQICQDLKLNGEATNITTACSSSTSAIGYAARLIKHGESSCVIAGGADEGITPLFIGTLAPILSRKNDLPESACRPFERQRDGHVLSDAACMLVLEDYERAAARGADIYCELAGYGTASDGISALKISRDETYGALAIQRAIRHANRLPTDVDYYCAHGLGERNIDVRETRMVKKAFEEHAHKICISSFKSMMGHPLGAAGAVQAAVCAFAIKRKAIPPTINYEEPDPECDLDYVPNQARSLRVRNAVVYSLGNGGNNAALVLSAV
jgi:3-oxoacyl-[acyl-carrier-protein] synthase II